MTAKKSTALEVSSGQLGDKLTEINDRLGALETIASLSNRGVVEPRMSEHHDEPSHLSSVTNLMYPPSQTTIHTTRTLTSVS